jgi:hypothetical protein
MNIVDIKFSYGNSELLKFCHIGGADIYLHNIFINHDNKKFKGSFINGFGGRWFRLFFNGKFYVTCNVWNGDFKNNNRLCEKAPSCNYVYEIKKRDINSEDILLNDIKLLDIGKKNDIIIHYTKLIIKQLIYDKIKKEQIKKFYDRFRELFIISDDSEQYCKTYMYDYVNNNYVVFLLNGEDQSSLSTSTDCDIYNTFNKQSDLFKHIKEEYSSSLFTKCDLDEYILDNVSCFDIEIYNYFQGLAKNNIKSLNYCYTFYGNKESIIANEFNIYTKKF